MKEMLDILSREAFKQKIGYSAFGRTGGTTGNITWEGDDRSAKE
jgi:hypothetical protein